jgi:hypothetical protein
MTTGLNAEWRHCSPGLLDAGVHCASTVRRPCRCGYDGVGHDHLVAGRWLFEHERDADRNRRATMAHAFGLDTSSHPDGVPQWDELCDLARTLRSSLRSMRTGERAS